MLLNTIGEVVTKLLNLAVIRCDGSWLTQLLLMLRSHVAVLHALCTVVCHLMTRQANTLSDCHAHALAAALLHWNNYADCSAGIRVRHNAADTPKVEVAETMPFPSYVLESLPLSTTSDMSFSLLFALSYVTYAEMIGRDFPDENRPLPDRGLVIQRTVDECVIIPEYIVQLLSYLGPRFVRDLRPHSSDLGSKESVFSHKFLSAERFLSNDLVRSLLDRDRLSFDSWVRKEIEVVDDEDLSMEWLSEYYSWVVFTCWHKLQSATSSATEAYVASVLQLLAQAVLDFDTRYTQQHVSCRHKPQHSRCKQSGRHNVFNLLQVSRHRNGHISCCHCLLPSFLQCFDSVVWAIGRISGL